MFLTVEGVEASGKSTLVTALADRLRARGERVTVTREPGGTIFGDRVRALFLDPALSIDPLAETFLLNASRAQLVVETIRPAIAAGEFVICDRYVDATLAYQGYGRGLDVEILRALCNSATGGLMPDLTLVLDLPVETAFERMEARSPGSRDRLERESNEFHRRVRDGYLTLARGDARFEVLNALRDPQALAGDAFERVAHRRGEVRR